MFSVTQIAERYTVAKKTVLNWIDCGDLRAVNVAREGSCRPKWKISEEMLREFEERRSSKRTEAQKQPA